MRTLVRKVRAVADSALRAPRMVVDRWVPVDAIRKRLPGRLGARGEGTPPAVAEDQERVAEALLSEDEQRRHVGELADADERDLKELAELRAKHRAQELAEERARRQS